MELFIGQKNMLSSHTLRENIFYWASVSQLIFSWAPLVNRVFIFSQGFCDWALRVAPPYSILGLLFSLLFRVCLYFVLVAFIDYLVFSLLLLGIFFQVVDWLVVFFILCTEFLTSGASTPNLGPSYGWRHIWKLDVQVRPITRPHQVCLARWLPSLLPSCSVQRAT